MKNIITDYVEAINVMIPDLRRLRARCKQLSNLDKLSEGVVVDFSDFLNALIEGINKNLKFQELLLKINFDNYYLKLMRISELVVFDHSKFSDTRKLLNNCFQNTDILLEVLNALTSFELNHNKVASDFNGEGIRIDFTNEAGLKTLQSLSKETKKWSIVLTSFARLVNSNNTDFELKRVEEGSVLITLQLEPDVIIELIKVITQIITLLTAVLVLKKAFYDFKKHDVERIQSELKEIKEKLEINSKTEAEKITNITINNYSANDKEEVKSLLKNGISYMVDHFKNGGDVQVQLSKSSQEGKEDLLVQLAKAKEQRMIAEQEIAKLKIESRPRQIDEGEGANE
ncbi:MAG: hypothetical protein P1U56_15300 [Saprospiraceae bacterium]|nr:hypothetical protein [Saprospiraceae bacterium]